MSFQLPHYVLYCLEMLESNGFEAWCVGGAVRDHLMDKQPFDYDITTNARPDEVISIFPKTVPTGLQHGTVTVVTDGGNVEITTYRADGKYLDHRTPDSVTFVESVDGDLSRRDFTMNAICYNPKNGFYDPENGIADIEAKTIRAIGEPERRFTEDALRIMRAFRFSAQLGFEIESNTLSAAISLSHLLKSISVERIYVELKRALTSKYARKTEPLFYCGAFDYLGLTIQELPNDFDALPVEFPLRMAYLCRQNACEPMTVLGKLKADNVTINKANLYSALLNFPLPKSKPDIKRMLTIGERYTVEIMLKYYKASGIDTAALEDMFSEILEYQEPYRIDMLDVNGKDLSELGFEGKEIGEELQQLLDHVIQFPDDNRKEILIKIK